MTVRCLAAALVCFTLACSKSSPPKEPVATPTKAESTLGTPFDLGAVMRQVRFAYRAEGEGWRGGYATYDVRVGGEGLELRPYHHPRRERADAVDARGERDLMRPEPMEGAPLKLAPSRIRRGGKLLADGSSRAEQQQDGTLKLVRDVGTERLVNGEEGVEQSWAFETRPEGKGDLVVEIPVAGLAYAGVTDGGLHFRDAKTGLGFRYGHGTWIDANDEHHAVPARFERGAIVLSVSEKLLASSAFPAVLDPVISPEFGLDEPVYGPDTTQQAIPAAASNGTDYFVVWQDRRSASAHDVFGTRVSSAGMVRDVAGLVISAAVSDQLAPAVASNGTDYFVVWLDKRSGSDADIYGTRVSEQGEVLDPDGLAVSAAEAWQSSPAVASDGNGYFVVWQDSRSGGDSDVYGTRVSAQGEVLDAGGLVVSAAAGNQTVPAVASSGAEYFVVWQDYRRGTYYDIYGTRVSAQGEVLDGAGLVVASASAQRFSPSVASNGTDYFVAWQTYSSDAGADIYGTRVSAEGVVQDGAGLAVSKAASTQREASVASNGTDYFVVWEDFRGGNFAIYGTRVTAQGEVPDPAGLLISSVTSSYPAIASNGTDYLVAWTDSRNFYGDVYGARVTAEAVVEDSDGLLLSATANTQHSPAVASNGKNFLVVWLEWRTVTADLFGTLVNLEGVVQDAAGFVVSTAANNQTSPAVASNGTDYLVVWQDTRSDAADIYGTRVSAEGVVQEPDGFVVSAAMSSQIEPAVASDGKDYLVVWSDNRTGPADIYGTRVSAEGEVQDADGLVISSAASYQFMPTVASNGTDYFVAWHDSREGTNDIYGARLSADGLVREPDGLAVSVAADDQYNPAVASNGMDFFVVWSTGGDIYGARVSAQGEVKEANGLVVSAAAGGQSLPAVASDGKDYFVAWHDRRSGGSADLYGTAVTAAGTVQVPEGIPLSVSASYSVNSVALSSAGGRRFLVVHEGFDENPATNAVRVLARFVTDNEAPVASAADVTTDEDVPLAIVLEGTDADDDALTYVLKSQPANGTLSGDPPNLTYTPNADFHGTDSFTFVVNDGFVDSEVATVSITVTSVNDAPEADAQSVTLVEDGTLAITLTGSDIDGDALTYEVKAQPANGTLTGTAPSLTYKPNADFHGTDSFTFVANDGTVDSEPATVSITVTPVNDAPVASAQAISVAEDDTLEITLSGSDIDGDGLTYEVTSQPANGTLSGVAPNLTYTPNADFNGIDAFTFVVNDGTVDSAPATISLTITPANDAPVAEAQSVSLAEDDTLEITLSGSDIDGDALTYEVTSQPANGTLSGLTYKPNADFHGSDSFTFVANDGTVDSEPATVSITVTPVNDAPVAVTATVTVIQGEPLNFSLQASDVDGDALTWTIVNPPAEGTLSGSAPELSYEAPAGFRGETSFTFKVSDGALESNEATLTLVVSNGAPTVTVSAELLHPYEGQSVKFTATAADPGGDTLTFEWDFGDGNTSTELAPSHAYQDQGEYEVSVTVSDGLESATATLTLEVQNAAPIVVPSSGQVTGEEGVELTFQAAYSDPGVNDTLTVLWNFGDGSDPVSGEMAKHTYQDNGTYTATVTVTDSDGADTVGTREVLIANLPPMPEQVATVTVKAGEKATATLVATDRAGEADPLTWTLLDGPGEVATDGSYAWQTAATDEGTFVIRTQVADDDEGVAESVFTVEVTRVETPTPEEPVGCDCGSGGAASLLWLGVLGLLRRRRLR